MIRLRAETPSTSHPLPLPTSSPLLQLLSSDHRTDRPEITLPPRKRLGIDLGPRYEIGESSDAASTRPIGGRRADYGFVQEQDTQDIYAVIEDTQTGRPKYIRVLGHWLMIQSIPLRDCTTTRSELCEARVIVDSIRSGAGSTRMERDAAGRSRQTKSRGLVLSHKG
ncbi:hypothetical protein Tco_1353849 [Tanacetum coccineum]